MVSKYNALFFRGSEAALEDEQKMDTIQNFDARVRHYIYTSFAESAHPPTTSEVAEHFTISISRVENAFARLADAHQIALAPGSYAIWMAHPFSGIATNFITETGGKKYWGN